MNVRALALGALVGFVVAFAPSCSPPKCGPQNCDGCCDSKGTCVKKPTNNNNTTCGSAGNACADCTATNSTCNSVTSSCDMATGTGGGMGTGGGTGGGAGGGTPSCDGCLLPSGTCVPLARTSLINCGRDSARCAACATGQLCSSSGTCEVPDAGVAKVASPCTVDADCATIVQTARDSQYGIKPFCKKFMTDRTAPNRQGAAYTGGYCTKRCGFEEMTPPGSCGAGNTCSYVLGELGESENMCFQNCTTDSECRTEYFCVQYSQTTGICLPRTLLKDLPDGGQTIEQVDGGAGFPGEAGGACTANTQCQPPAGGVCQLESLDAGFVGGACTAECSANLSNDEWCGTGGACSPGGYRSGDNFGPVVLWFCERGCGQLPDGGIVGTCRDGYVCDGTNQFATCVPKCTNSGVTCTAPDVCNATTGACQPP